MRKTVVIIFAILIISFIVVWNMDNIGAGIIFPKTVFGFKNLDENFYWGAADKAVENATDNTPNINILFARPGNSFYTEFDLVFLTKKNYSKLYIDKISYWYNEEEYVVLTDVLLKLSSRVRKMNDHENGWITNGKYYWYRGRASESYSGKLKLWPKTNFEKIFKEKKDGDVFPFSVRIIYRFDDEELKSITHNFTVTAYQGKYQSMFFGW